MSERQTDILIVGGGLGGVAAALAALRLGRRVILTEETDWLGGQLTAQAVPPDDNPWVEQTGCTASYRLFRKKIRDYYHRNYPLKPETRNLVHWNPRAGSVYGYMDGYGGGNCGRTMKEAVRQARQQ